jgi:hypothetical protein
VTSPCLKNKEDTSTLETRETDDQNNERFGYKESLYNNNSSTTVSILSPADDGCANSHVSVT